MRFIGLILLAFIVQALAFPTFEDPSKPEHIPEKQTDQEVIEQFRRDVLQQYSRFQTFYDLFTERMTNYRLEHADLVSEIGLTFMEVFSIDLDEVRTSKTRVDEQVALALTRLGGSPNACLNDVLDNLSMNSGRFGEQFNACCRRANATIANGLNDIFYPTFDDIQRQASAIPLLTLSALSRGNPFHDPQAIVDYLDAQFRSMDLQWKSAASQLFRWETARFDVEGRFYVEEMTRCLIDPLENYINTNSINMFRIVDECAPN